jgi:hypothetical protein
MCPKEWDTQWKLYQKMVPQSVSELVKVLETTEEAYNAKRAREKSKGSSDGKRKNGHMSSPNVCIPKKAKPSDKPSKKCKLCKKYGGKPLTYYTSKCKKYNPNGSVKKDIGKGGKGSSNGGKDSKCNKAHFAQMKKEYQEMKCERTHLKKLNKKLAKKAKKRTIKSDLSDSDAS